MSSEERMTYEQAVEYISNIPRFTSKNKPEHTRAFLKYLGQPQKDLKVVHVAGTNGKGSVCAYLEACLRAQGKSVGLFTSPHLVKMNERIVVNGREVSDEEFSELFNETLLKVRRMEADGLPHPTFFEFLFGMAVLSFFKNSVEYAVLETGLGGRLDATNTIEHPLVTVITSIGFDHMEILGDTLEKIAAEKAGIIKPKVPVFYAEGQEESNRVIEEKAKKLGAPCNKIGKSAYEILGIEDKHIAFSCTNAYYGDTTWSLSNIGVYQPGNAVLALEVMRELFGEAAAPGKWRTALSQVVWPGRMEEVLPEVYVDGAHNVSAVEAFVQSTAGRQNRNIILFSAVQDKEYEEMIRCLCQNMETDFYMITLIDDKRAAGASELWRIFKKYTDKPVMIRESLEEALSYVLEHRQGRTVYCLGSLYLAGMIKAFVRRS